MALTTQRLALGCFIVFSAIIARAQNTPVPPDWQDGRGASVYLASGQQAPQLPKQTQEPQTSASANNRPAAATNDSRYTPSVEPSTFNPPPSSAAFPARLERVVKPVVHEEVAAGPGDANNRQLAPRNIRDDHAATQNGESGVGHRRLVDFGLPAESIYTVVTALVIVIGAFLLFAWALRRGGKNSSRRRSLVPTDAVSVLGRVMLTPRQFAELLRVGNKLVLVAMTPAGPATITEVTDAAEVDRIVGLCQQSGPLSTTKAFEQVFQQLSNEPTTNSFLGSEAAPAAMSLAASAYRSQRGTARV